MPQKFNSKIGEVRVCCKTSRRRASRIRVDYIYTPGTTGSFCPFEGLHCLPCKGQNIVHLEQKNSYTYCEKEISFRRSLHFVCNRQGDYHEGGKNKARTSFQGLLTFPISLCGINATINFHFRKNICIYIIWPSPKYNRHENSLKLNIPGLE